MVVVSVSGGAVSRHSPNAYLFHTHDSKKEKDDKEEEKEMISVGKAMLLTPCVPVLRLPPRLEGAASSTRAPLLFFYKPRSQRALEKLYYYCCLE